MCWITSLFHPVNFEKPYPHYPSLAPTFQLVYPVDMQISLDQDQIDLSTAIFHECIPES